MNILVCHNLYRTRGGEDSVFEAETALLRARGHAVRTYTRDSRELDDAGLPRKLHAFVQGFASGRTRRDIAQLVAEDPPDVVHVHNVWPLISPTLYGAVKDHGIPVVQTIHNFRFFCINGLLLRNGRPCHLCQRGSAWHGLRYRCLHGSLIYSAWYAAIQALHRHRRTFTNLVDRYIALNGFTRTLLIDAGFDPERVVVKPNAATVSERHVTDEPEPYLLFVGRLSEEKGVMTLLRAARLVPEQPLRIIGDGPLAEAMRACIDAEGMQHVEMLGYQPPEVVERHLARATACVFTSECYENCPLAIVNSVSLGTPVIASNVGGVPEFIPEDETGWLFPPGDYEALAERMRRVAANRAAVNTRRPQLREWGRAVFSEDANYDALMRIYHRVIGKS